VTPSGPIEPLSSERVFEGRIFDVLLESLRLPSGLRQDLAVVRHPGAVAIAALDTDGRLLLVRQYRHAVGDWTVEIPAGRLEPDEQPLNAARRELEEETGHRAATWKALTAFHPAPGFCSEVLHMFLATGVAEGTSNVLTPDDDEELEVLRMTPREVLSLRPADAKTLIAAYACLLG
jgi:ADP-ribose pyrophosphatase